MSKTWTDAETMEDALYDAWPEPEPFAELPQDDGAVILLDRPVILVEGLGEALCAASGVWCERAEDGGMEPDWSLTYFWVAGRRPDEMFYLEQDGLACSLHNLSRALGKDPTGVRCAMLADA